MFWLKKKQRLPEAFAQGWLPELDGHEIFYHQFGNPNGKIMLVFHGGPGGSSKPKNALRYDLKKYRVILFDQRGCGKSRFKDLIYKNTPLDAVKDAKRILEKLYIKNKVIVSAGSYGSTLALLFAENYPEMVEKLWIASIFLARKYDFKDWEEVDAKRFYPEFIEELKKQAKGINISEYFAKQLFSGDKKKEMNSLKYYGCLEHLIGDLNPEFKYPSEEDYEPFLKATKIKTNMVINNFFLKDNHILKNAKKIAHIPTIIVHNRLDMCCPIEQAWELHKALPKSKLYIVPDYGHGSKKMEDKNKEVFVE